MRDTQRKGDLAVSIAIATITKLGYDVSIPLTESAPYDIVVDTGKFLRRVQVRFTSTGAVDLRRVHSNSKGYFVKKMKNKSYDWLYIYMSNDTEYLIKKCIVGRRSIKPTRNYLLIT